MKEEKIDRLIRNTLNDGFLQNPSAKFTDKIMEELGVSGEKVKLKIKPVKSKWGLISMIAIYAVLILAVLILPGSLESSGYQLPKFELPSLSKYFTFSGSVSKMLIALIFGGWFLIFIDKYAKKFLTR